MDGSCNRVEDDGEVERSGQFEAVGDFFADGGAVRVVQVFEFFEEGGGLGYEGPFDEEGFDVC